MDFNLVDKVNNYGERSIRLSVGRPLAFMLIKLCNSFSFLFAAHIDSRWHLSLFIKAE